MTDRYEKARLAREFRDHPAYAPVMQELRERQIATFEQSEPQQIEERERAKQMLTALKAIEQCLDGWENDHAWRKKGQHRVSD